MSLTSFTFDLSDPQARAFVRLLLDGLDQKPAPQAAPAAPLDIPPANGAPKAGPYTPIPVTAPPPPPVVPDPPPQVHSTLTAKAEHKAKVLMVLRGAAGPMRAGNIAKASGLTIDEAKAALADRDLFGREGAKRWYAKALGASVAPAASTEPETPHVPVTTPSRAKPEAAELRARIVAVLKANGKSMRANAIARELGVEAISVNNALNNYAGRLFLRDGKERHSGWLAK